MLYPDFSTGKKKRLNDKMLNGKLLWGLSSQTP
jgi:hypothetical protein